MSTDETVRLVINAGGGSRRMGQTKALLPVPPDDTPLLRHIVDRLQPLRPHLLHPRPIVVANDPTLVHRAGLGRTVCTIADERPDAGPLAGLAAALRRCSGWALFIACDMPFLNAELLHLLCSRALSLTAPPCDVVLPVADNYAQPLHALYHRRCLAAIEAELAAGHLRMESFLPRVRVQRMDEATMRCIDPELRSFINVNTPEEWAQALAWIERSTGPGTAGRP